MRVNMNCEKCRAEEVAKGPGYWYFDCPHHRLYVRKDKKFVGIGYVCDGCNTVTLDEHGAGDTLY